MLLHAENVQVSSILKKKKIVMRQTVGFEPTTQMVQYTPLTK